MWTALRFPPCHPVGKSSIDDEDSLSGCVAVNVGDDMYLKLPDDSGNGEEVEIEDEVTIDGEGVETSDGPTKFMVGIGCSGDGIRVQYTRPESGCLHSQVD